MSEIKKNYQIVLDVEKDQLSSASFEALANFYSLFADPTRLALIVLLSRHECCVSDIVTAMHISQSRVSHQLQILRKHNIVTYKRCGKMILYSLSDEHIESIVKTGIEHVSEDDENFDFERRKKGW